MSSASPNPTPRFLVVDDNDEHRFLLVKTLLRKFPEAVIQECKDGETAQAMTRAEVHTAIVVHRTHDATGVELVRAFRTHQPRVPILMVSGIDRAREAQAAGATAFLLYDEWLRVGTFVASLLEKTEDRGVQ